MALIRLGHHFRRRNGKVAVKPCSQYNGQEPQDWAQQQLEGCWFPGKKALERIRQVLGPLVGCGSCAKVTNCELSGEIETAQNAAFGDGKKLVEIKPGRYFEKG